MALFGKNPNEVACSGLYSCKSHTRGKGTLRKIVREIQSTFKGFTITLETHNSFIEYWRQFDNHIDTREVDRLGYIKIRLDSTLDF